MPKRRNAPQPSSSKKRKVSVSKALALYKPPVFFDNAQSAVVRQAHNAINKPTVDWRLYVIQLFCMLDRFTITKLVPSFLDPSVIYAVVVYKPSLHLDYADCLVFDHWKCNLSFRSKHSQSRGRYRAIRYANQQTVQWRLYVIRLFSFLDRFTIRKLVPFFVDSSINADHDMLCRALLNFFGVEPNQYCDNIRIEEYQAWITRMFQFSAYDQVQQVKLQYDAKLQSMQQKYAAEIHNKDRLIASLLNRTPKKF